MITSRSFGWFLKIHRYVAICKQAPTMKVDKASPVASSSCYLRFGIDLIVL